MVTLWQQWANGHFLLCRATDEVVNETEKNVSDEKPVGEEEAADVNKENPENEPEEKEPEDKVDAFHILPFFLY